MFYRTIPRICLIRFTSIARIRGIEIVLDFALALIVFTSKSLLSNYCILHRRV